MNIDNTLTNPKYKVTIEAKVFRNGVVEDLGTIFNSNPSLVERFEMAFKKINKWLKF